MFQGKNELEISFVLPTFNERKNIIPLLNELLKLSDIHEIELIVVDDNSTDDTSSLVRESAKKDRRIRLINRLGRSGLSSAIKEGCLNATGEIIAIMDTDGQHEVRAIMIAIQKLLTNKLDLVSIKKGEVFFNKTKSLDHVQALVIKEGKILAKEGRLGTKKMLSKLKKKSEGILIKLPKKKQDLRMDLPTIGLQTFIDIKKYGLRGVVLQSKKNIFLDKVECIKFANKNKIFINII